MELEATVAELAPRVLRYCLGRTGAPEVAEEALTALVGRWRRHGPPDSPEAFVFAVARRRAFRTAVRRQVLLPLASLGDGGGGAGGGGVTGGAQDARPPAAAVRFHVTNRNGVVVIQDADGGATFLYSRERPSEPPRGMRMIVRGGTRP